MAAQPQMFLHAGRERVFLSQAATRKDERETTKEGRTGEEEETGEEEGSRGEG